jgi:phosphoribosylamine---glycine ligase
MKILLIGSGAREHALARTLANSPSVTGLIAAPGNPGIAKVARLVDVRADDVMALASLAADEAVDLVVVGPEAALAAGLADLCAARGIACFGPSQAAAALEASKAFTKDFCRRHAIPTADFEVFDDAISAKMYLAARPAPYVIKADGLAQGKGVVIAQTLAEADAAVDEILFLRKFGTAGQRIVIEDFLPGEEVSIFALCDGERAVYFGAAQDHKRAFDQDKGPNTGGMGAYAPAPVATPALIDGVMATIIAPTVAGMAAEGRPFRGVLFAGIMASPQGPKLIEFNARFGDPECQTLLALFEGDLAALLMACATGRLDSVEPPRFAARAAVTVVMAAQGYPDQPLTGSIIRGVGAAEAQPDTAVLIAGARRDEDGLLRAAGGRVLNVLATGATLRAAVDQAYAGCAAIDWPGGFYRRDIAWRALQAGSLRRKPE